MKRLDPALTGVLLCVLAYGLLGLQDAAMKWLVADQSVPVSLFFRSLAVTAACVAFGRGPMVRGALASSAQAMVILRAAISIVAWILYYTGARDLSLAEMTVIYFSAPVMVVVLAVLVLKERVGPLQWASVAVGFAGVIVAVHPTHAPAPTATALVLLSALLWAFGYILLRRINGRMTVGAQVLVTNIVFCLVTGVMLPFQGPMPGLSQIALMAAVGLIGGAGQYALFASFERASAAVLAPFEYTGLIWAFLLGALIWGTRPDLALILGAVLIAASGLIGVHAVNRDKRRPAPLPDPALSPLNGPTP
ncbi:DMT family transporter [Rhodobacter lacus]|uniref:DMT family transporter n=1 Tax=Rhodobacter lacus TaxID=1641972 RepID=A0ABW5A9L4_9RHOB